MSGMVALATPDRRLRRNVIFNRRKVKEEDIPKYGKAVGTGTLVIGVSLALSYAATFWNEAVIPYITVPSLVIGLAFILYGQIKYNHGIF